MHSLSPSRARRTAVQPACWRIQREKLAPFLREIDRRVPGRCAAAASAPIRRRAGRAAHPEPAPATGAALGRRGRNQRRFQLAVTVAGPATAPKPAPGVARPAPAADAVSGSSPRCPQLSRSRRRGARPGSAATRNRRRFKRRQRSQRREHAKKLLDNKPTGQVAVKGDPPPEDDVSTKQILVLPVRLTITRVPRAAG